MNKEELNKSLDDAVLKAALGDVYVDKTITRVLGKDGREIRQEQIINERKSEPNIDMLKRLLSNRIGGPEDYC